MKRRFVARWPARVRITTSVTSQSFFKTVCYDASFTFIHNSIFKNTYRCRFIHRDLSFLTLFLFTFSICDGHSKFLFKSIKAFNRSFFVVCLEQVCLYSAWRKKPVSVRHRLRTPDCRLRTRGKLQTESKTQAGCKMQNKDCRHF